MRVHFMFVLRRQSVIDIGDGVSATGFQRDAICV